MLDRTLPSESEDLFRTSPPMVRTVQMVSCPGCGELVEAVCYDGEARGWCSNAGKTVTMTAAGVEISGPTVSKPPEIVAKQREIVSPPTSTPSQAIPSGYVGMTPGGRPVQVLPNDWGTWRAYPRNPDWPTMPKQVVRDGRGLIINGRDPDDLLAQLKAEYPDWSWR